MADNHSATELELYINNEYDLTGPTSQGQSIIKNLATKKASGRYDHDKAVALFMYLTETGAKKYAKEFGGPGAAWHEMFPIGVRRLVAAEWRSEFESEYANGAYDNMLPKKYQGAQVKANAAAQTKRLATGAFLVGQRVQMHPATDAFMMGDRYGQVVKIGKSKIHVEMDRSRKTRLVLPRNLQHMEELGSI